LDVVFNGPFKRAIDELATAHLEKNINDYLHGNFTASERRILLTKWIGQVWEQVAANKDMVIRGFKKCAVSVTIDGSEDNEIHIKDLEDYDVKNDDDDPFVSSESKDGNEVIVPVISIAPVMMAHEKNFTNKRSPDVFINMVTMYIRIHV